MSTLMDHAHRDNTTIARTQRVELSPHLDRWMRGDRFGAVTGVSRRRQGTFLRVKMDRSGESITLPETVVAYL